MRIAKPKLAVGRPTWTLRRVAYRTQLDLGSEVLRASHGRVEVIDLEPQQHAVPPRVDFRLAQRTVMVLDVPAVQLEDEPSVAVDQSLIVRSAVVAASPEQTLEPLAGRLDIVDGEEWLWAHDWTVATAAHAGARRERIPEALLVRRGPGVRGRRGRAFCDTG
jgi:hypothetical protein